MSETMVRVEWWGGLLDGAVDKKLRSELPHLFVGPGPEPDKPEQLVYYKLIEKDGKLRYVYLPGGPGTPPLGTGASC